MDACRHLGLSCLLAFLSAILVQSTYRYYNAYISFGSGDTIIQPFHIHGGTQLPHHKWSLECLDGEAMVGIADNVDDFNRIQNVWCKFTFALKPPTNGLYPYYPRCHVRNLTDVYHCYDPLRHELTSNTFITAMWAGNLFWWIYRIPTDNVLPYKCCKTPLGYYIDYVSCYYVPTHDMYFEYYDNIGSFIVYCTEGYVMTGISKKINPYTKEYRYDWIQCCRVGIGRPEAHPPPVTYMHSGVPAYSARARYSPVSISAGYLSQYRARSDEEDPEDDGNHTTQSSARNGTRGASLRYSDDMRLDPAMGADLSQLLLEARGIRPGVEGHLSLNDRTTERRRPSHWS